MKANIKFKKGDIVRCISPQPKLLAGDIYRVSSTCEIGNVDIVHHDFIDDVISWIKTERVENMCYSEAIFLAEVPGIPYYSVNFELHFREKEEEIKKENLSIWEKLAE